MGALACIQNTCSYVPSIQVLCTRLYVYLLYAQTYLHIHVHACSLQA